MNHLEALESGGPALSACRKPIRITDITVQRTCVHFDANAASSISEKSVAWISRCTPARSTDDISEIDS